MSADLDLAAAEWVKSSYSGANGGECVEFSRSWVKSSYNGGNGGNCLEFSPDFAATVPVRDSKTAPDGPALRFTPTPWTTFLTALKSGGLPASR